MTKEYDLISPGIPTRGGIWADFGSGTGIFTQELCELLGPGAEIYSIDRNGRDLERQRQAISARYPQQRMHYVQADFTKPLELPPLDGIVMANALHFVRFERQAEVLARISGYLRWPGGRFILVEYNARSGNIWVPYPVDSESFTLLAAQAGLGEPEVLSRIPSRFLREMYSAVAVRV
jgi:ubiquinone/menaquinone biosynthesis C-methylase UbiE